MIEILNSYLLKYNIDYPAYLILYDLYYNTNHFSDYFLSNQEKNARSNIDRGSLTTAYFLINSGLLENNLSDSDVINKYNVETMDVFYKRLKLTTKAKEIVKIINDVKKVSNPTQSTQPIMNTNVESWIDEYRHKWVRDGKMLKATAIGNKQTCIDKMKVFMETYPQYSKETILWAAERYISDHLAQNFGNATYLITAPYFIKREKTVDHQKLTEIPMRLEDYCELILNETKDLNNSIPAYQDNDLA
jgi:hypothetical protein